MFALNDHYFPPKSGWSTVRASTLIDLSTDSTEMVCCCSMLVVCLKRGLVSSLGLAPGSLSHIKLDFLFKAKEEEALLDEMAIEVCANHHDR